MCSISIFFWKKKTYKKQRKKIMKHFPYGKSNQNIFHLQPRRASIFQRQRETNKNNRDEWGNWDGQFLQDTKILNNLSLITVRWISDLEHGNKMAHLFVNKPWYWYSNQFSIMKSKVHNRNTYSNLGYGKKESPINYKKLMLLLGS